METPNTGTGDSEAMDDDPIDTAGNVRHNRGTSVDYYMSSEAVSKSSKANSLSALYGSSTGKEYISTTNVSTATAFPNSRASPTHYGVKMQEGKEVEKQPEVSICDLVVKYYFIAFLVSLSVHVMIVIISIILFLDKDYELFNVDFKGVPMFLTTHSVFLRSVAYEKMDKAHDLIPFLGPDVSGPWSATKLDEIEFVFTGNNVLTKKCLTAIDELEKMLTNTEVWKKWGQTDEGHNIMKPYSIIRIFDGSLDKELNDTQFTDIPLILYNAYNGSRLKDAIEGFISEDAVISPEEVSSTATRSVFSIGLHRFTSANEIEVFWRTNFVDKIKDVLENGLVGMRVYYYNKLLFFEDIMDQVDKDLLFAIGSLFFIILFVLLQTQSIFITFFGVGSIFTSFLWTNFAYRVVLGYKYFGIFHAISIFIILGIGTDDLFVFFDTWRATACMDLKTTEERFSYCYSHATLTMLITSLTTSAAFACNIFTPLFGISSFAVFASMLVMINYFSAVFFFPTCVLMYHKHLESFAWPCLKYFKIGGDNQEKRPNIVIRFFKGPFYRLITHRIYKWIFILSCTGVGLTFAYFASYLESSKRTIQYYKTGHNYDEVDKLKIYGFKKLKEDDRIQVRIVFGAKEVDMSLCDQYDYNCNGNFSYDNAFDLNPIPAQKALMDFCQKLKNVSDDALQIYKDPDTGHNKVLCFIEKMDEFFKKLSKMMNHQLNSTINISVPISGIKYTKMMSLLPDIYNPVYEYEEFYRFFETAVSFWLSGGYKQFLVIENIGEGLMYSKMIGLSELSEDHRLIFNLSEEIYGARLRYAVIKIYTKMFMHKVKTIDGLAAYSAWENYTQELMKAMPPSVQGFQVSNNDAWHFFSLSEALLQSARLGILVGTILAFVILIIATSNIILAGMATINILLVVATFAGFLKLADISISVIESINLSLVTGLAVDYVVHLSFSYHHAPHQDRLHRVRDMLENMALSILSGAVTTCGAVSFMLGAKIYFFFEFGIFILVTILCSLVYSMFWFTPLLSVIGPEGDLGSMYPFYNWLWGKIVKCVDCWLASEGALLKYSKSET